MSDSTIINVLLFLLLTAAIAAVVYYRSMAQRPPGTVGNAVPSPGERFIKSFYSTLSGVMSAEVLDRALSVIADGLTDALGGSAFIFSREGQIASLTSAASEDLVRLSSVLLRVGLKLDPKAIPLHGGRAKVFTAGYSEFEDAFPLIGDLVTSAACRRIQSEMRFGSIATLSVSTIAREYLILVLLPSDIDEARTFIEQFGGLLSYSVYLLGLKKKLTEFEKRFDEQVNQIKKESLESERAHTRLFERMPVPAAVLDGSGVVLEVNRSMHELFEESVRVRQLRSENPEPEEKRRNPIGQSFSSMMNEKGRQDFAELLLNLKIEKECSFRFEIPGKYFNAHVIADEERDQIVVYLLDETAALLEEKELAAKSNLEQRRLTENILKSSAAPLISVVDDKIGIASGTARELFSIHEGETCEEFCAHNGISNFPLSSINFEISTSSGRMFSVLTWEASESRYYYFEDVTESKKLTDDLRKNSAETQKLFNWIAPVARVRDEKIIEWNDRFSRLLEGFLESESGLDAFLSYLGMPPPEIRAEIASTGEVQRICAMPDGKAVRVYFSSLEDSILIRLEEISGKQSSREEPMLQQSLLENSLDFLSGEPAFVLESGKVTAANSPAKEIININPGDTLSPDSLFAERGVKDRRTSLELNGFEYNVESLAVGNLTVFRLKKVAPTIISGFETSKSERRTELLSELETSEDFDGILNRLQMIFNDRSYVERICAGVLSSDKESADVYWKNISLDESGKYPAMSLSPADLLLTDGGGVFARSELPGTPFASIISGDASRVLMNARTERDLCAFTTVAIAEESASEKTDTFFGQAENLDEGKTNEIIEVLKVATSAVRNVYLRSLQGIQNHNDLKTDSTNVVLTRGDEAGTDQPVDGNGEPPRVISSESGLAGADDKQAADTGDSINLAADEPSKQDAPVNQDTIFGSIREGLVEKAGAPDAIMNFDVSVLTEFRAKASVADLIKDVSVGFILVSEVPGCEVLMMTVQPSPNELAAGKGNHFTVRLTAKEGTMLDDRKIKANESISSLVDKLEGMGYEVDIRAIGNELTLDICENSRSGYSA